MIPTNFYKATSTIVTITLFLLFNVTIFGQEIPERPSPPRLVNDLANVLTQQEQQSLENKLVQFSKSTSTQIVVLTVNDLNGSDAAGYAFKVGEEWGVGQKGKDNGVVVLVKPKTASSNGRAFIAPGYGLEEVIPDAITNRIIDVEMIPHFKQNNYFGGINAAVGTLMNLSSKKYTAEEYVQKTGGKSGGFTTGFIISLIFLFIVFRLFMSSTRRKYYNEGGRRTRSGSSLPFWLMLGMMGSGTHRGSYGNFSSGGGSFGGFGGFGGGSFGGGGAGGSW